jgi:hypothetical protein
MKDKKNYSLLPEITECVFNKIIAGTGVGIKKPP